MQVIARLIVDRVRANGSVLALTRDNTQIDIPKRRIIKYTTALGSEVGPCWLDKDDDTAPAATYVTCKLELHTAFTDGAAYVWASGACPVLLGASEIDHITTWRGKMLKLGWQYK